MEFEQQDRPKDSEREAAKHFVRSFYKEGELSVKRVGKQPVSMSSIAYDAQVTASGQVVIDHEGKAHHVNQAHLVVTRIGHLPCFAVFALDDLIAEIHDEERGFPEGSLAAVFAAVPQPLETEKRRRPVAYRSYNAGRCQNPACPNDLGYLEVDGGRDRKYCNDACRVAAHRARKREKEREQTLQYNSELRQYWQENGIRGEVLYRLQEILLRHGKLAAKAATDAVIFALQAQAGSTEQFRLIDEVMAGGERIGFEELKLDEFRIAAGIEGWSEFVSHASHSSLKEVRYYLQERRHHEERKAIARKHLSALGAQHKGSTPAQGATKETQP